MIEISVIIPSFNRRELLARALRSVLAQQQKQKGTVPFEGDCPLEIIVVDDGSTDGTGEMIAADFPMVNYFYQDTQGPSAARNRGLDHASGKWIAFLDSDDEWLPGKLKAQLDFFAANPDSRICQTEEIWIRNGRRVNPMKKHRKYGGEIFEKCLPLCVVSPSAVMIHRSLFEEVGTFDESLPVCEDYDLWLRIAARNRIGLIETPYIIKYGGHADQLSHALEAMDRFRIQSLAKILAAGILNEEQTSAARRTLEEKSRIYIAGALKRGKTAEAEAMALLL